MKENLERYPESRLADVYKLLYQSCMGPEHAIAGRKAAEAWLIEEWAAVSEGPDEPLYEDITIEQPVLRLNLRPAKARGLSPKPILDNFAALGDSFRKDIGLLQDVWKDISRRIKEGDVRVADARELAGFNNLLRERRYPPMHHSDEYFAAYKPAYRLVGHQL